MEKIGVDALFDSEGKVTVRRIQLGDTWQPVEQGRQWLDEEGRHVLIMVNGRRVQELLLDRSELTWYLQKLRSPSAAV